jgi:hypothetical protein
MRLIFCLKNFFFFEKKTETTKQLNPITSKLIATWPSVRSDCCLELFRGWYNLVATKELFRGCPWRKTKNPRMPSAVGQLINQSLYKRLWWIACLFSFRLINGYGELITYFQVDSFLDFELNAIGGRVQPDDFWPSSRLHWFSKAYCFLREPRAQSLAVITQIHCVPNLQFFTMNLNRLYNKITAFFWIKLTNLIQI